MDLGLIIFIIFVLIKVFGKASDIKGKIPKDWETKIPKDWQENWPPVPKGFPFPWEDALEEVDDKPLRAEEDTNEQGRRRTIMEGKARLIPQEKLVKDEETATPHPAASYSPARGGFDEIATGHPLLNSDALLNGIIMSELLQPPKSRRRR